MGQDRKYDVFKPFLVERTEYAGSAELPIIKTSDQLPERVVTFSKAMEMGQKDFDRWVVFYEDDHRFERLWNRPRRYLEKLKKFKGVISPDFSMYRNMPLVMQAWNTYRGRALASWLAENGTQVIPNVRFGDERTYSFCFDGIEKGKTIAVGTHGCIKKKADRACFVAGLAQAVKYLCPKRLLSMERHRIAFLNHTRIWVSR